MNICILPVYFQYNTLDELLSTAQNILAIVYKKDCTVVVNNYPGHLGNALFQFASAYGLSLEHSCRLYLGPTLLKELNQYFEVNMSNILTESELQHTALPEQLYSHCTYFSRLSLWGTSQHIELMGYWQAQKHFLDQTDQIRKQLQFKQTVLDPGKRFIETQIKNNFPNLIGVHITRGDFMEDRNISSDQFIFDAMAYFTKKYTSTIFILVSDDKPYCREVFGKRNDTIVTPDSFTAAEDMATITLCHDAIITVGTYGWWAGYLLNNRMGEILTDSKPDHSPLDVVCEPSVFFPPWFKFINQTN